MTDLKFVVDTTDLDKAITKSNKIEREIRKLVKAEKAGAISTEQYSKRVGQLASQLQSATGGNIRARKSVYDYSVATREAAKQTDVFDKEVVQTERTVRRYNRTIRSSRGYVNQFGENVAFSGKRVNKLGANMQQAGYQIGDFAVQVQGGTNLLVALGQQGAQLAGIFGPAGALAGAGLAISTALLIPFTRGAEEASKLVDRIKELREEIKQLKGIRLPEEFEASAKKIENLDIRILNLEAERDKFRKLADEAEGYQSAQQQFTAEANLREREINRLLEERNSLYETQSEYSRNALERARLIGEQEEADLRRQISLSTMQIQFGKDSAAVKELEKQHSLEVYEEELKRQGLHPEIIKGLKEQKKLAMDLAGELGKASAQAVVMANALGISVTAAQSRINLQGSKTYSGRGSGGMIGGPAVNTGFDIQGEIDKFNRKGSRGSGGGETQEEFLAKLQREIDLKKESIGVFGEERKIMEEVARLKEQVIKKDYDISEKKLEQIVREDRELERQLKLQQELYDSFHSTLANGLMDLVTGAASVEDAFKQMLFNIVQEIYRQAVVDPIATEGADLLSGLLGGLSASAKGNVFFGGRQLKAFASGGVVDSPTLFPMRGNSTGLMGEAGAEAIMPLKRTANGDLGVQVANGGQGSRTEVVVSLSPELIAQVLQQAESNSVKVVQTASKGIVNASVQAVAKSRRQGGPMKAAFGK